MKQSSGRPATQIEVEAMTAIAKLQDENRELKLKTQTLIDAADQAEAERLDACNQRNFAFIELEEVQVENNKLREMARAMVKWEQVALKLGEDDPDSASAFKMGLMLHMAIRLAKEVLGEGEVELEVLKRVEEVYRQAESNAKMLDWLEAGMQKSLGTGPWYEAACQVHLSKLLHEALQEAMAKENEVTGSSSQQD